MFPYITTMELGGRSGTFQKLVPKHFAPLSCVSKVFSPIWRKSRLNQSVLAHLGVLRGKIRARAVRWVRVLATKADAMDLILKTKGRRELMAENGSLSTACSLWSLCVLLKINKYM